MLAAPMFIDVRPGAVARLGPLLADLQIARQGRVAIAVGPAQGASITGELCIEGAEVLKVPDGSLDSAVALGQRLRAGRFEVVAGIGGGKTVDVTKFAAHMAGIPMVAVTTSLGHDGIASPVSTLRHESGTGSYGVVMPVAVIVDLDRVRSAPASLSTAGIGDAISDLSAVADWELAAADVGERIDGLAVAMARSAALVVLHQPGHARTDEFLTVLAESLILSGMAMAVAGSSLPASGGDHEIMHAVNQLFPGTASHGELAGVGALFCTHLRGNADQAELISACLHRHGLPRTPEDLGLSNADFAKAVAYAPETRPGRYTILERLALSEPEIADRVENYVKDVPG
ncbi:iron-containing alcohol dehydrogenase family protein [Nonomuraea sp. K274]|uniref:Iron-containing alcohol dehydrogenase family protein n=1 Tax=Nonomuraea cypriaca TaxID=1187855 RepID=A0A931F4Q4_9ACTN|nr:iron-containing alcohol dehydrogenase family protein [Nonomuraea cypriaca]MBF8191198.1 iron-containing alcohol dehydrogenase family protein [Nonomuraea cypriaca]